MKHWIIAVEVLSAAVVVPFLLGKAGLALFGRDPSPGLRPGYRDINPIDSRAGDVADQTAVALHGEPGTAGSAVREIPVIVAPRSIDPTRASPFVSLDEEFGSILVEDRHGRNHTRAIGFLVQVVGGLKLRRCHVGPGGTRCQKNYGYR